MSFFHKERQLKMLRMSALVVFHILLFVPILKLFGELNNVPYVQVLVYYFLFTQILLAVIPKWWLWIPAQIYGFAYAFYRSFPYQEPFGMDWIRLTWDSIRNQFFSFVSGETTSLPVAISLLLFMSLSTLASISLLKTKKAWPSFLICFVYLLILQIFTENQVVDYLIPVLVIGMGLVGITHLSVNGKRRSFLLSLGTLSAASLLLSRLAVWSVERFEDQQEAVQAQATTYQQELETRGFYDWIETFSRGQAFRQTGYGESDSQLGGPIQQDFTPVFNAYTESPHYWRISTKELYTGIGWEREIQQVTEPIPFPFSAFPMNNGQIEETETIRLEISNEDFTFIPYTYGTKEISYTEDSNQQLVAFQMPSERFLLMEEEEEKVSLNAYQLLVQDRAVDADLMRETTLPDWIGNEATEYLQVPDTVPERVKDLAHEITQDATTQYDQVKAIEQYLKNNEDFRYSMQDAAFVPDGWDYVDHFLFESKVGYCDHFSTSMAVLARSLGIPTRWAKGFSSGELVIDDDGSTYRQITNANAHSWPEVYFEGYGWIPFEPTPSFAQPVTETQVLEVEEPVEAIEPVAETEEPDALVPEADSSQVADTEPDPVEIQETQEAAASQIEVGARQAEASRPSHFIILFGLVSTVVLSVLFFFREKLMVSFLRQSIKKEWLSPYQSFHWITRLFEREKKKAPNQTIRRYYEQWIVFVPEKEEAIQTFIQLYEENLYAPSDRNSAFSTEQKEWMEEMLVVYEKSGKRVLTQTAK